MSKNFKITFEREIDRGFQLGITPIWFHKHAQIEKLHYHFLFDLLFWYLEITIGDDRI